MKTSIRILMFFTGIGCAAAAPWLQVAGAPIWYGLAVLGLALYGFAMALWALINP